MPMSWSCVHDLYNKARGMVICLAPCHFRRFPAVSLGAHLTTTSFDLATEVAGDVVSHQIWGPRKKSWSLPMTILAGVMRGAGRHSNLVDIVRFTSFLLPSFASDHVPYLGYYPDVPGTWRTCAPPTGCARHPRHLPRAKTRATRNPRSI